MNGVNTYEEKVILRPTLDKSKRANIQLNRNYQNADDEDEGVYDESYRASKWIFMNDDEDDEKPETPGNTDEDDGTSDSSGSTASDTDGREVYTEKNRADSISSTASASEYRRVYREVSLKRVKAALFMRQNTASVSADKIVKLRRDCRSKSLGFHVKGSHPTTVTTVVHGGIAELAGLEVGDVILAVNDVGVLHMNHDEIVGLLQQKGDQITLELCKSSSLKHMAKDSTLSTSGGTDIVFASYLCKLTNTIFNIWSKRWFVLREDNCLYYYKTEQSEKILGVIPISDYMIQKANDSIGANRHAIKLTHRVKTYYLAADTELLAASWAKVLNDAAENQSEMADWLAHNVSKPALSIKKPDCHGFLYKSGGRYKAWKRRYAVLKDGCLYYYMNMDSENAQGVAHLHGYKVHQLPNANKRYPLRLVPPEPTMRVFDLYVDSETEKDRWVYALIKSISRWVKVS